MDNHGGWAKFLWGEKTRLDCGASPKVLAYWIAQSATDLWTFNDLSRLVGAFLDSGDKIPTALEKWALEVAAKRRTRPARTGPKSDRKRDARIAAAVAILEDGGMKQKLAIDHIGRMLNKSPEGIKSARRRGLQKGSN